MSVATTAAAIGSAAIKSQPNGRPRGDDQRDIDNAKIATAAKTTVFTGEVARVIDQNNEVPAKDDRGGQQGNCRRKLGAKSFVNGEDANGAHEIAEHALSGPGFQRERPQEERTPQKVAIDTHGAIEQ